MTPIDVQVIWSKVKVKLLVYRFNIIWPLCMKVAKLVQWMPLGSTWPLFIFRSQSKVKVKLLVFEKMFSTIYLDPFAEKFLNLIQWMPLGSRWPLLMFRSHGERTGSNCWYMYLYECCPLSIFWSICLKIAKPGTVGPPKEWMFPVDV